MAHSLKVMPNYTYEDYLRWEGRWEIIEGIAFDMSPMPSPEHQRIANQLGRLFSEAIEQSNCSCTVYQPIDLKITENTVVNPDLLIICEAITGLYYDKAPQLVVEILSPSTRLKDLHNKYDLYQNFGIAYYIIIDPSSKEIFVYHLMNAKYTLQTYPYEFTLKDGCRINVDLGRVYL
jgi:Uma2 family endonuclease